MVTGTARHDTGTPSGDARPTLHGSHTDVLVIGAGISGIGAAHRLRTEFPDLGFVVLEAQDDRGGTWWTHRFPGVRSDSDLFTYGYRHKPWRGPAIASGDAILDYLDEVLAEDDLAPHIHYHHRVTALEWSSGDERWTARVTRSDTGEHLQITAGFLWMCQGYYDHDAPHTPHWPGRRHFEGPVVHPGPTATPDPRNTSRPSPRSAGRITYPTLPDEALASYRTALEAGAEPSVVATWMAETQARRAELSAATLRQPSPERMTEMRSAT
ncbi:flavin-containing monooxygenase [Pseudonocardia sp. HH130630-07]|uniref:flavin-containing monooxygenase n=1 Tax=Pseudonocardia sp. HH130630-07 TaxID=1690815 RepID=UPI0009F62F80|nr:NAD(P)/FAD-dependent oxidoreductase [Pseudonocardia sp. HH130630-07]